MNQILNDAGKIEPGKTPLTLEAGKRLRYLDLKYRLLLSETFESDPERALPIVNELQKPKIYFAALMKESSTPLIPIPEDLKQIDIGSEQKFVVLRASREDDCPGKLEVTIDVILDALDIREETEELIAAIGGLEGMRKHAEKVAKAIKSRRLSDIKDRLIACIQFLSEEAKLKEIQESLRKRRLALRLAMKISKRMANWLGWFMLAGAVGLAVHKHWHRIICNPDALTS